MSDRVRQKVAELGTGVSGFFWPSQWKTGVLVYTGPDTARYGEIVEFNAASGRADHTEIDAVYFEKGYTPREGEILDPNRVIIYEIKTSAKGTIDDAQLGRLKQLQGGDI